MSEEKAQNETIPGLPEPAAPKKICAHCRSRFSGDARFCPFDGEPLRETSDAPRDHLLGSVVDGRYEIDGVIGEGGMGTVYRARHRVLERPFALKVLRSDLSADSDLGERFLREAKAAASISHPSVVEITDFGALPSGQPYFVMELVAGESLSSILHRGGPLPAARAVRLLVDIVAGLGAAHAAGVIHRDLKPDNVLVCRSAAGTETVKILDFGLAKVAGQSRLTRAGVVFGTPHYMSPEQASGGAVDRRTDIYALGVVMYEMFTGRVPFEADSYMGVLTKHLYVAPTPPSVLLGGLAELGALERVVLRCLEKKPERRYASMDELGAELARVAKFGEDGGFTLEPAEPGERRAPRLADELELPTDAELRLALARSGILPRRLSKKAIVALVVAAPLFAAAALWAIARTQSNEGPEVKVTQALRRRSVAEVAPAISAPPVARPAPPIEVTPAPATSAPVDTNRAAPARRTRAYPVVKAPPHSPQKGTSLPASGLANDPIAKDKLGDPGIVDPWR